MQQYRTWEEVDLSVIRHNFESIRAHLGKEMNVMAVLKANAYATGMREAAAVLKQAGAAGFCAATQAEAHEMQAFGLPVQILGGVFDFELEQAVADGAILGITDLATAERYSAEAVRQNKTVECHFKLDTGMGRLGILYQDAPEVIRAAVRLPNLHCCGIYSHFPKAYSGEGSFAAEQAKRFLGVLDSCAASGITFEKVHMANSDAINLFDRVHHAPFNFARAGIDMYGEFEPGAKEIGLKNAVNLYTRLVSARRLSAGWSIGYERTCILQKDTLVGTIAAGYADGLPLPLSNQGKVILNGHVCPVLGRISMDYTTISLDGLDESECKMGTPVVLWGESGGNRITATDWAKLKGTHEYEILCAVSPRVARIHVNG